MRFDVKLTADDFDAEEPRLALRRHTDRCFFRVEEIVPHPDGTLRGFLIDGVMIAVEDVAELRRTDADGGALPTCDA